MMLHDSRFVKFGRGYGRTTSNGPGGVGRVVQNLSLESGRSVCKMYQNQVDQSMVKIRTCKLLEKDGAMSNS
jgi:hypothetical protein